MNIVFEKLFFAVFLVSAVTFFDILIRFKRPLILKFLFLLITSVSTPYFKQFYLEHNHF